MSKNRLGLVLSAMSLITTACKEEDPSVNLPSTMWGVTEGTRLSLSVLDELTYQQDELTRKILEDFPNALDQFGGHAVVRGNNERTLEVFAAIVGSQAANESVIERSNCEEIIEEGLEPYIRCTATLNPAIADSIYGTERDTSQENLGWCVIDNSWYGEGDGKEEFLRCALEPDGKNKLDYVFFVEGDRVVNSLSSNCSSQDSASDFCFATQHNIGSKEPFSVTESFMLNIPKGIGDVYVTWEQGLFNPDDAYAFFTTQQCMNSDDADCYYDYYYTLEGSLEDLYQ